MSVYSNIIILSTSVLFATDPWLARGRTSQFLAPPVLQVVFPRKEGVRVAPSGSLPGQRRPPRRDRSRSGASASEGASAAIPDPPFLRRPILFAPSSLELNRAARNTLKRAAGWLQRRREARILIVGSCDSGGSEPCTHTLAEARGAAVQKFLGSAGVDSTQIVGVKGWDNLDQRCRPAENDCQRLNRSARIFMASSVAP